MSMQTLTQSLGVLNQSFPIWDLGAWFYWNARRGRTAQTSGAAYRHGGGFLSHAPASSSEDNLIYDPARNVFREYDSAGDSEFPPSGITTDGANNVWAGGDNASGARGFSAEAGLTGLNPITTENRDIVELLGGGPADSIRYSNFSGVTKRASATWDISFSGDYVFSVLVRRSDRAQVDSSTCTLIAEDSGATDITTTPIRYIKIGDKGWYLLYVRATVTTSDTVITWGVDIAAGITNLYLELPGVYDGSAFGGEHTGWCPIRTDGVSDPFRSEHEITLTNVEYSITSGGWIGATFIPIFPSTGDASAPASATYETSVLLVFRRESSSTERIRFLISNAVQMFRFDYDATLAGAGTSLTPDTSFFKQGVPVGMVLTWGYRSGTLSYTLFVNGKQVGIHSSAPIGIPDFAGLGELQICHQSSANACNVSMQQVALGNKRLPRTAGRNLSRWFERQARYVVGQYGV